MLKHHLLVETWCQHMVSSLLSLIGITHQRPKQSRDGGEQENHEARANEDFLRRTLPT